MPINGLTNRGGALPRIAQLRKGGAKVSENQPGPDLDYFRFVPDDPNDLELVEKFEAAYGPEPKAIEVYLPFATVEENFDAWMKGYGSGSLKRKCNGVEQVQWLDTKTQRYRYDPIPCACTNLPESHPNRCKQSGILSVIIPALQRFAYVGVVTSSLWDILNLDDQLRNILLVRDGLRGVPFLLKRTAREISRPNGKGPRVRSVKHLLSIELHPRFVAAQFAAMEQAALPAPAPVLALPGPDVRSYVLNEETGVFEDDETELIAAAQASEKFWSAYGEYVGTDWQLLLAWWGESDFPFDQPQTADDWAALARMVKARIEALSALSTD